MEIVILFISFLRQLFEFIALPKKNITRQIRFVINIKRKNRTMSRKSSRIFFEFLQSYFFLPIQFTTVYFLH